MTNLFYSETAQNILGILCQKPKQHYHINDLIRKTGKYPYSVQTALRKLKQLNLVTSFRHLNKKFYQINQESPIFPEIRNIFSKLNHLVDTKLAPLVEEIKWTKTVNRLSPLPYQMALVSGLNEPMKSLFGFSFKSYWHNGITGGCYYDKKEFERASQKMSQTVKDSKKTKKVIETFEKWTDEIVKTAQQLNGKNLSKVKNKQLLKYILDFKKANARIHPSYIVPLAIERALFSDIKSSLELILSVKRKSNKLTHYLDFLTAADPEIEERTQALKIAVHVKKNGFDKKTKKLLTSHAKKYAFLSMYFLTNSPLTINDFYEEMDALVKKYRSPQQELAKIKKERGKRKKRVKKFFNDFHPSKNFKDKVKLFKKINDLRTQRACATSKANFYFKPVYLALVKKMKIPQKYHYCLTLDELVDYLKTGRKPTLTNLKKREKGWAVLVFKGRVRLIIGLKEVIETMERLRIIPEAPKGIYPSLSKSKSKLKGSFNKTKSLKGIPVYSGLIQGKGKLVKNQKDLKKIKVGNVLISNQVTPAHLSALYKTAGMVINEGTLTSHAALYAKALKIPTIIGTEVATEVFKDGDKIKVDAIKGVAEKI